MDYTGLPAICNNFFIEKTKNLPLGAAPDRSESGISRFNTIVGILGKDMPIETMPHSEFNQHGKIAIRTVCHKTDGCNLYFPGSSAARAGHTRRYLHFC